MVQKGPVVSCRQRDHLLKAVIRGELLIKNAPKGCLMQTARKRVVILQLRP